VPAYNFGVRLPAVCQQALAGVTSVYMTLQYCKVWLLLHYTTNGVLVQSPRVQIVR
jgi:hypothetical protein